MAPKKDKGKKEDEKTGTFNEVEKTFLELQIGECNRKIARLRAAVEEYETRNDELQKAYDKLDEDRADIISYLKKTLTIKNEENSELKEKVKGLEEIRDIENSQFHETVSQLEKNFTIMKDQLTSENKLLAGKLNTLEEFRAIRDDLMRKFEKQEEDFREQEIKYKRIIYDAEKKFVISKDKLKKEMESRLLQLAQDFQDATELRIAASTQRVIRENIAVTNEIDNILLSQKKIAEQNDIFKEKLKSASIKIEIAENERDKAINKSLIQVKLIDQLTAAFENIKKEKTLFEKKSCDFELLQIRVQKLTKENDNLVNQIRVLEQNLYTKLSDQNKGVANFKKVSKQCDKLKNILQDAAFAVQSAIKLDQWADTDPAREAMDRKLLLSQLLEIISQYREIQESESSTTVASFSKVYQEGDLGFIPKSIVKKGPSGLLSGSAFQQSQDQHELVNIKPTKSISLSESTSAVDNSIKTIPSIQVLPASVFGEESEAKVTVESLTTSMHSLTEEQEKDSNESRSDIKKQLLASELEIQKSIMKDLVFADMSYRKSQLSLSEEEGILSTPSKFITIVESIQQLESEKAVTEPTQKILEDDNKASKIDTTITESTESVRTETKEKESLKVQSDKDKDISQE